MNNYFTHMKEKVMLNLKSNAKIGLKVMHEMSSPLLMGFPKAIEDSAKYVFSESLKNKFDNLLIGIYHECEDKESMNDFFNNLNDMEKNILSTLILKALNSENDIKVFLLIKIFQNKYIENKFDYFHSTLLANIDTFVFDDFKCYYDNFELRNKLNAETDDNTYQFEIAKDNVNEYNLFALEAKLKNSGILLPSEITFGQYSENSVSF